MDELSEQIRMRLDRLPCPDPCACGPCICAQEIADLVRVPVDRKRAPPQPKEARDE
jgi:hypothetical protein